MSGECLSIGDERLCTGNRGIDSNLRQWSINDKTFFHPVRWIVAAFTGSNWTTILLLMVQICMQPNHELQRLKVDGVRVMSRDKAASSRGLPQDSGLRFRTSVAVYRVMMNGHSVWSISRLQVTGSIPESYLWCTCHKNRL